MRINPTIMELKCSDFRYSAIFSIGINPTIMELKSQSGFLSGRTSMSINPTIMELKYKCFAAFRIKEVVYQSDHNGIEMR